MTCNGEDSYHALPLLLSELRNVASEDPRYVNVSMSFDIASLAPTYQLCWGSSGASNALDIAQVGPNICSSPKNDDLKRHCTGNLPSCQALHGWRIYMMMGVRTSHFADGLKLTPPLLCLSSGPGV